MDKQPILKQIVIGAFVGMLFGLNARFKEPNPEPLLSAGSLGLLFGAAIGGVVLYVVTYQLIQLWMSKK